MGNRDIFRAASGVCLVVASELTHISGRNCLLAADERDVGLSPLRTIAPACLALTQVRFKIVLGPLGT